MAEIDTITCEFCNAKIPPSSTECPKCGATIKKVEESLVSKAKSKIRINPDPFLVID